MALKGSIAPGSAIIVRFAAGANNSVQAELIAGFAMPGDSGATNAVRIGPGDSGEVAVHARADGVLRVHVHLAGRRGDGTLEVRVGDVLRDMESIQGDTWWFYTIKHGEDANYAVHGQHRTEK